MFTRQAPLSILKKTDGADDVEGDERVDHQLSSRVIHSQF